MPASAGAGGMINSAGLAASGCGVGLVHGSDGGLGATPKYKTKYRVQNWPVYETPLRQRGEVTIWFEEGALPRSYRG